MKILRLRLSNLNSLRGANAVDFTLPPLAHSGLFAITGPTGAGKTTLLDAITLALYGRVARYGTTPSPDAVMSRHTGECSAEVEFTCAAGSFRSVWQLQRARKKADGKLQQAKRRVIALPAETVIAESIKDADAKILELTGLDYDRFLRSVLLAQGDFAAFLKAGPKERTDLLQQVTGTAVYQDISHAAFRRATDAEQAHAALLRDHQAVSILDPETRSLQETTLATHARRLAELDVVLPAMAKRLNDAQRWLEIGQAARQLQTDETAHAAARRETAPALARLDHHEKAVPFLGDLTSLDHLATEQAKDAASLRELEVRLPELARSLQTAEAAAVKARSALEADEVRHAQLRVVWTEVTALDRALATAREALRQLTTRHIDLEKAAATITTTLATEQTALKKIADAHTAAAEWLAGHSVDAGLPAQLPEIQAAAARWSAGENSALEAQQALARRLKEVGRLQDALGQREAKLPPLQQDLKTRTAAIVTAIQTLDTVSGKLALTDLEARRDGARDRRLGREKLVAEAARLRALVVEIGAHQQDADHTAAELVRSGVLRQNLQRQHADATKLLAAHRTALALAERLQSFAGHRAELKEGEPCPLCGAVHHPYADPASHPADDVARLRQSVTTAETELDRAQLQLTEAEKHHASLLADQKRLATNGAKLDAERATLTTAWSTAATAHRVACTFAREADLLALLGTAQAEETQCNASVAASRAADLALQQARAGHQTAQTEYDGVQAEVAKQVALIAQAREQLPSLETALATHRTNAAEEKAALARLVEGFAPPPAQVIPAAALLETLKTRAAAFSVRQSKAQTLLAEHGAQKAKVDALSQQLTTATSSLAESHTRVAAAKTEVETREAARRAKFGDRAVDEAQREAETGLRRAREVADTARLGAEKLRQSHAAAAQEKERLTLAAAARTTERETIAARLHAGAATAGFADEASVRTALLPAAEFNALTATRGRLEERRITLAAEAANLARQRAALPPSATDDAAQLATLQVEHAAHELERATRQGFAGEIRAIIKNDDAQRERQAAFGAKIEAARRDHVRWDRLRALIGSADGSLFARFAQGLTLERLTLLANGHLTQLNPRYSIRRAADGDAGDLELEIVDHYQADAARPMQSLSGGESFLVSLALALGLSELASGRTSIESLFIDEGFGSLDAETLETAMAALENLQAEGKTIGVISHVPAMQERIPTQIAVTKESRGCSSVTIKA